MERQGYADLRHAHGIVLENIGRQGTRQSEMAERALVTKQAIAQVVSYLAERGYVERTNHPTDGRAALVTLTPTGREMIRVARQVMAQLETEWAECVGIDRLESLRDALHRLTRTTDSPNNESPSPHGVCSTSECRPGIRYPGVPGQGP